LPAVVNWVRREAGAHEVAVGLEAQMQSEGVVLTTGEAGILRGGGNAPNQIHGIGVCHGEASVRRFGSILQADSRGPVRYGTLTRFFPEAAMPPQQLDHPTRRVAL